MSERQPGPYDDVARKWHALAERRCAHFAELRETGRWRHYYTWESLIEAMREAATARDNWAKLAALAPVEPPHGDDVVDGQLDADDAEPWRKAG